MNPISHSCGFDEIFDQFPISHICSFDEIFYQKLISFVLLSFCLFVFLSFCLFVFSSRHLSDQMSEGYQVSKVTLCVKILKWHSLTHSLTQSARVGIELPGQLNIPLVRSFWHFVICCICIFVFVRLTLGNIFLAALAALYLPLLAE